MLGPFVHIPGTSMCQPARLDTEEMMVVLELTKDQVFDLVRQMPAEQKREMLLLLAKNAPAEQAKRQQFAEEQLRRLCVARGLDWGALSADEREAFIDDLIHEDRTCAS
jgi:hypothetical protein